MIDISQFLKKSNLLPILALLLVTFSIYSNVLDHSFINTWDDDVYVTANEAVKGFSYNHIEAAFTKFYSGNYAPIQILSYMLDYSLWGLNAGGFLFFNILYHAVNGILFYYLLIRIYQSRRLAFLASFIFLCHPVQVESVAWVSQRKNLLAMIFFLASFHAYLSYADRGIIKGKNYYFASLSAFIASLLSKAITVIMAPVLLLYDHCFATRSTWKQRIVDKLPFVLATIIISLLTYISQTPGRGPYFGGSPLATAYTMLPIFVRYLRMVVWPTDLCASYTLPIRTAVDLHALSSAAFFIVLFAGSACLYRFRRDLFFWFALFFIGLIPVSQVIPILTLMNDRYLYFPMIGSSVCLSVISLKVIDTAKPIFKVVSLCGLLVIMVAMSYLTVMQVKVWESSITLWSDVTSKYPDDSDAWNALGDAYLEDGDHGAALTAYKSTISACDRLANCQYYEPTFDKIGSLYVEKGKILEAKEYFTGIISTKRNYPGAINQLDKVNYILNYNNSMGHR
jgi:protein O-mannosyl-transferase